MIQLAAIIVFLPVAISGIVLANISAHDKKPQNATSEEKAEESIPTPQIEVENEIEKPTPQPVAKKEIVKKIKKPALKVGVPGNCESYRPLVAKYFPENQVNNALLVMGKESGCRPNAINKANRNGSVDYGLFQVNSVHRAKVGNNISKFYDAETNIRIAAEIYKSRGNWSAWYAVCTPDKMPKYAGISCR